MTPGTPSLSPSSYVILGLVRALRQATPYDLKQLINDSIGYFWDFPQSQLYAEASRLVDLGLLDEEQEQDGRRRRRLTITEDGKVVLRRWITEPVLEPTQIRDPGLLKLFFADAVDAATVSALAASQVEHHLQRLEEYGELAERIKGIATRPQRLTLEFGLRFERSSVTFWEGIQADPPV